MPFPYGQARLLHAYGLLGRQQANHATAHAKFTQALAITENLAAAIHARLRERSAHTPSTGKPTPPGTMNAGVPRASGLRILTGSSPERTGARGREIPEIHS